MSTDYTLHCKECDATPDEFETSTTQPLVEIYALREHIMAIVENNRYQWVEVGYNYCIGNLWQFLSKHKNHEMDIQDEYGRNEPIIS